MGIPLLWSGYLFSTVGGLAALVSTLIVFRQSNLPRDVRHALTATVIAVVPGVVFVQHAFVSFWMRSPVRSYDLFTIGPAAYWILVGPMLIVWSLSTVRLGRAPRRIDLLRLVLAVGWGASSLITVMFGAQV